MSNVSPEGTETSGSCESLYLAKRPGGGGGAGREGEREKGNVNQRKIKE